MELGRGDGDERRLRLTFLAVVQLKLAQPPWSLFQIDFLEMTT